MAAIFALSAAVFGRPTDLWQLPIIARDVHMGHTLSRATALLESQPQPQPPQPEHTASTLSLKWNVSKQSVYEEPRAYVDQKNCHLAVPAQPVDMRQFCTPGDGCWPGLWLLGAQKAATSAVYDLLEQCGVVAGAWPSQEQIGTVVPSHCAHPCKETHFWTGPLDDTETKAKYESLTKGGTAALPPGTLDKKEVVEYTKMAPLSRQTYLG